MIFPGETQREVVFVDLPALYFALIRDISRNQNRIILIIKSNRNYTTENTVIVERKRLENLQVEKLSIMFVSESQIP